ncbi:MAG: triose-phosphate isomerase [Alphaproteobacteria bacterium]|jgi:triosephosphate isomerase|nr:triose-phosphate isomerase [Alphaproteobacteria bacterium]
MKKIIVANWKMNGSLAFVEGFMPILKATLPSITNQIIICPPFPYIESIRTALSGTPALLGAQNCHAAPEGAFTGEVSAVMLKDLGCTAVIIGHSERRTQFGEDNDLVNAKVSAAHAAGMTAIVCVGESLAIRESGQAVDTVVRQLHASLPPSVSPQNTRIAYEPVWAIGTGKTPTSEEIIEMHLALHTATDSPIPLIYGGSVTDNNSDEILSLPHVDGVLVGGASLKAESFRRIMGAT